MLSINTNLSSLIAQNSMKQSTNKLNQAIERMTTGFKINHAKDNAANYSIITNMTTKIGAYMVAEDNALQGLDMISTASESLSLIEDKLMRLRALATQASNDTYGKQSLSAINTEANAIVDEINRIYSTAEYNGIKLFEQDVQMPDDPNIPKAQYNGFIKEVVRRDTSTMTKLSSVDGAVALADGTYSISTPEEMKKLADMTNAGLVSAGDEFVLANDIDLSQYENWTPIGYYSLSVDGTRLDYQEFNGKFDGNGYIVSNLKIHYVENEYFSLGLFGCARNAEIKNLCLKDVNIISNAIAAPIVGFANDTILDNCSVNNGEITSNSLSHAVGGLLGDAIAANVLNCYSNLKVNSSITVGGLLGYAYHTTIDNCYSASQVSSTRGFCSGGLVGNSNDVTITKSAVLNKQDALNGVFIAGVLAGANAIIQDCYYNSYYDDNSIPLIGKVRDPATSTITIGNVTKIEASSCVINLQVCTNGNESSQIKINSEFILNSVGYLRNLGLNDVDYLTYLDKVLSKLSAKQTELGSASNRLESALDEISTQYENLVSSRSTIRDADIAEVSSHYIQQQILQQASATLLSTANQSASIALSLI